MSDIATIMRGDPSGAELVKFAEQTAKQLVSNNLTRSQIRNIFNEVRKIETLWGISKDEAFRRLNMLKPKLEYIVARNNSVQLLRDVLCKAIDEVNAADDKQRDQRFQRFIDLVEAILAYHRAKVERN